MGLSGGNQGDSRDGRATALPLPRWRILLFAGAYCFGAARADGAESKWVTEPYRIQLVIGVSPDPRFTPQLQTELADGIITRVDAYIGAPWQVTPVVAEGAMRSRVLRSFDRLSAADLPSDWGRFDKILILAVDLDSGQYRIRCRELDVATEHWSPPVEQLVANRSALGEQAFRELLATFAPIAEIASVSGSEAVLRWRAASLPPRDKTFHLARPGQVLLPLLRTFDRDGKTKRVQPVEWTYLVVGDSKQVPATTDGGEPASPDVNIGTIYSGVRGSLGRRRSGRTQQLALAVRPQSNSTRLELRSRGDDHRPLAGYSIYAYPPAGSEATLLGQTDRDGTLEIPIAESPLRMLVIKHGNELLAKLPVMPGLTPTIATQVADDDPRLAAEGFIVGLQERLVDVVVRRQVLLSRLKLRVEEGDLKQADQLLDQLRRLESQQQFLLALDQEEQRSVSSDPRVRKKIERLFSDTRKLVGQYLDPREVNRAEIELDRARKPPAKVGMNPN